METEIDEAIKVLKEWQQRIQTFLDVLIKEGWEIQSSGIDLGFGSIRSSPERISLERLEELKDIDSSLKPIGITLRIDAYLKISPMEFENLIDSLTQEELAISVEAAEHALKKIANELSCLSLENLQAIAYVKYNILSGYNITERHRLIELVLRNIAESYRLKEKGKS